MPVSHRKKHLTLASRTNQALKVVLKNRKKAKSYLHVNRGDQELYFPIDVMRGRKLRLSERETRVSEDFRYSLCISIE